MPEFTCRLGTPGGEVVTRLVEADGIEELRKRLEREGFRIFSIDDARGKSSLFSLGSGKSIKFEEFLLFNQQFSTLLRAGLPMVQALSVLIRRQPEGTFRTILEDVERRIKNGAALSDALDEHPTIFPRIYTASVLAGERSGELDKVLIRYVNHAKQTTEMRRKLKKTLTYPVILISASIALVILLTVYVIPKFASLYDSAGSQLPALTQYVVAVSLFFQQHFYWIAPLVIVGVVATYFWQRTPAGRDTIDRILLKLPVVGDIIRQSTTARLSRSMATLLAGGLTLLESLEIASESVTNQALGETMVTIVRQIREGQSLLTALENAAWLPAMAMDMIGVGEKSGALGQMLDEVAFFYDAELDVRMTSLTALIEPIVLAVMGGVVLTVLLALYLPILQFVGK